MAEEMTGIERLREAAETVYSRTVSKVTGGVIDVGRGRWMSGEELTDIADRIEREHAAELAAKRDLPADAREVVERMRALDVDCTWGDVFAALFGETISPTGAELRYRLCDLIEHGGKQGVDVAALRELADEMDELYPMACADDNDSHDWYCGKLGLLTDRIRKAIEVAQEPDPEREAAADWVEAHGGQGVVKENRETLARIVRMIGFDEDDLYTPEDVVGALDKRLMPEGMEWPRDTDGNKVDFGEEIADDTDDHGARAVDSIKFVGGIAYLFDRYGDTITSVDTGVGERVERPKPAVLGADGMPIEPRQTVYYHDSLNANAFIVVETTPPGGYASVGIRLPFASDGDVIWVDPQRLTHTPSDTQERIDEDKDKEVEGYWGCDGCNCEACPSLIGNEKPCEHYGVANCAIAQDMDIARREQELRARTTGGAR